VQLDAGIVPLENGTESENGDGDSQATDSTRAGKINPVKTAFWAVSDPISFASLRVILDTIPGNKLSLSNVDEAFATVQQYGQEPVVLFFLQCERLTQKSWISQDSLFRAFSRRQLQVMTFLLERMKDEHTQHIQTMANRALAMSCELGHVEIARSLLVSRLSNPNAIVTCVRQHKPGMEGIGDGKNTETCNSERTCEVTPLQASLYGFRSISRRYRVGFSFDEFKTLVFDEWDSNFENQVKGHLQEIILLLIDHGADPNYLGAGTEAPIASALKFGAPSVIRLSINAGAVVNTAGQEDSLLTGGVEREMSAMTVLQALSESGVTFKGIEPREIYG
jgi:hypothetical protein